MEWEGVEKAGVKGLKGEIWGMGIRGGKAQSLAKRNGREKMEEKSEPAPTRIRGCDSRPGDHAWHPPV